jgi:hypothetical protein
MLSIIIINQCCGSGSGRILNFKKNPGPDMEKVILNTDPEKNHSGSGYVPKFHGSATMMRSQIYSLESWEVVPRRLFISVVDPDPESDPDPA